MISDLLPHKKPDALKTSTTKSSTTSSTTTTSTKATTTSGPFLFTRESVFIFFSRTVIDSLNLVFAWWSESKTWSSKFVTGVSDDSSPSYDVIRATYYVLHNYIHYALYNDITRQWVIGHAGHEFWASGFWPRPPCKNQIEAIYHRSREKNKNWFSRK